MIRIKLISRKKQGTFKKGQTIRVIEVEQGFDLNKIQVYYDLIVIPIKIK